MQVGFESPSIGVLCNNGGKLVHAFGSEIAEKVKDLLFYLVAAPTLADLSRSPPVLRDQISDQLVPQFTVGKAGNGQVLFQPHEYIAGQNLSGIENINIISVGGSV